MRLWKTAEDSKARVSVRRVRVRHTKKIRNTTITNSKKIEQKFVNGVEQNSKVAEEKKDVKSDVLSKEEYVWAYQVTVECYQQ